MGDLLYRRRLVHGSSGNLSVRLDDGWLVTPTNSSLGTLDPAGVSRLDASGRHIGGDPTLQGGLPAYLRLRCAP